MTEKVLKTKNKKFLKQIEALARKNGVNFTYGTVEENNNEDVLYFNSSEEVFAYEDTMKNY